MTSQQPAARSSSAFLPELHEGHAPISLLSAFEEAIYAVDDWHTGPEPMVAHEDGFFLVSDIADHLRECTDYVPRRLLDEIDVQLRKPRSPSGSLDEITYARAARILMIVIARKRSGRYVPELISSAQEG